MRFAFLLVLLASFAVSAAESPTPWNFRIPKEFSFYQGRGFHEFWALNSPSTGLLHFALLSERKSNLRDDGEARRYLEDLARVRRFTLIPYGVIEPRFERLRYYRHGKKAAFAFELQGTYLNYERRQIRFLERQYVIETRVYQILFTEPVRPGASHEKSFAKIVSSLTGFWPEQTQTKTAQGIHYFPFHSESAHAEDLMTMNESQWLELGRRDPSAFSEKGDRFMREYERKLFTCERELSEKTYKSMQRIAKEEEDAEKQCKASCPNDKSGEPACPDKNPHVEALKKACEAKKTECTSAGQNSLKCDCQDLCAKPSRKISELLKDCADGGLEGITSLWNLALDAAVFVRDCGTVAGTLTGNCASHVDGAKSWISQTWHSTTSYFSSEAKLKRTATYYAALGEKFNACKGSLAQNLNFTELKSRRLAQQCLRPSEKLNESTRKGTKETCEFLLPAGGAYAGYKGAKMAVNGLKALGASGKTSEMLGGLRSFSSANKLHPGAVDALERELLNNPGLASRVQKMTEAERQSMIKEISDGLKRIGEACG